MRAEVIFTTGQRTSIMPENGTNFSLNELYDYIGCETVEIVRVGNRLMIVDEDGLAHGKKINSTASFLANQPIVGNVVLCDASMIR